MPLCLSIKSIKVYLPAIEGHVPEAMVQALHAFLEFCYLARWNILDSKTLDQMQDALDRYHIHRKIFQESGVHTGGFNLP
jgi:hypothetical protein